MPALSYPRKLALSPAYALFLYVLIALTPPNASLCLASEPRHPFPAHFNYTANTLKPNHLSRDEQDNLVREVYKNWKKQYLISVEEQHRKIPLYRISAGKSKRSKSYSEGQGYGMILAVYMASHDSDSQAIFNGLWMYSRQHSSRLEKKFMAYQVPVKKYRRYSAFDGDCDMAFALFLADAQWGSEGVINYKKEALALTGALLKRVIGEKSNLPMLGDWVKQNGRKYNQYTVRSSDLMPTHFKLFHRVTGDKRWLTVLLQSQSLIENMQLRYGHNTGLLPDFLIGSGGKEFSYRPAPSSYLESTYDGQYFYNAARVPWRLAADALLNHDQVSLVQVRRIAKWILKKSNGDPKNISPGYHLDGRPLNNGSYTSKAFAAPLGVAAMTLGSGQEFLNRTFDLCLELKQDYFEDTLGLHCLLLMTGNYWLPTGYFHPQKLTKPILCEHSR